MYLDETKLRLQYNNKKTSFCSDIILWGTNHKLRFEYWILPTNKTIILEPEEINDIKLYGVRFFEFKYGVPKTVYSLYKTYKLFGGSTQKQDNINFLKENEFNFRKIKIESNTRPKKN